MAPGVSTSALTSVLTAISRSVPESLIPRSVVSTRILARTGRVVFPGILGPTATNPSWSFSLEIVNRIPTPVDILLYWTLYCFYEYLKIRKTVVTAGNADMWKKVHKHLPGLDVRSLCVM
jgi:hypothetical protein